jgi:hypothetical protein
MYASNVKEMTREEVRIAALQQQRIIYWRAMEREGSVAPAQSPWREQREGSSPPATTCGLVAEPC